jgi:hypothetical protein
MRASVRVRFPQPGPYSTIRDPGCGWSTRRMKLTAASWSATCPADPVL